MYSEIVQRTPSIYFKFDDQNHRNNFSKSSYALDYSVSNQKHVLSQRFNKLRSNTNTVEKHELTSKQQTFSPLKNGFSPLRGQYTITVENSIDKSKFNQEEEDQFMKLHRCRNNDFNEQVTKIIGQNNNNKGDKSSRKMVEPSSKKQSKLKTQDFFQQFDQKYSFTFEDDIRTHEFIPQAEYEGGSKISRGYLDFEQFPVEETMKLIQIDSKKDLIKINTINSDTQNEINQINNVNSEINSSNSSNLVSFVKTNQHIFSSHVTISDQDSQKTKNKKNNPELSNQRSENFSTDHQNHIKNSQTEFQEVISFGPNNNTKTKKYVATNCRHFITKDFNNNSSIFEKSKPIIEPKRRVPFKHIQNLIQKNAKDQTRSQTRKKPIINTDLLISTINKTEKHQVKQTHGVWSNPINNKKSSSLESTFTYDNMFKTNAFRETLKSTTLENWRKKYHKKIENLGEKKTVSKKQRDSNIFENLFIRA